MREYNAAKTPNAREWLALSEVERIDLIIEAHQDEDLEEDALMAHAGIHAAIETQLAMIADTLVPGR